MGQQRYKFLHHNSNSWEQSNSTSSSSEENGLSTQPRRLTPAIPTALTNSLTRLTSAFVCSVGLAVDVKYQLLLNFGGYLAQVPARLGVNEALDASAHALVESHAWYCTGSSHLPPKLIHNYSAALNALIQCLDHPTKARAAETLCAIAIIMIVQVRRLVDLASAKLIVLEFHGHQ